MAKKSCGCTKCGRNGCPLCENILESDTIYSTVSARPFRVRAPVTCNTKNVCYVVSCNVCGVQGVGEGHDPRQRYKTYVQAASRNEIGGQHAQCAIHRHFMDSRHDVSSFEFQIVDALPGRLFCKPTLIPALRKRMECRWIRRLQAQLNVKRFIHYSFTGDLMAIPRPGHF